MRIESTIEPSQVIIDGESSLMFVFNSNHAVCFENKIPTTLKNFRFIGISGKGIVLKLKMIIQIIKFKL